MGESKKARSKRKRKNKARAIRKEDHDTKRRDHAAFAATLGRRRAAGHHGQGRPDKEESKTCCREKIDPNDHLEED